MIGVEFTCVKIGQRTIDLGIKKTGGGAVILGGGVDFTLNAYNYGPGTVGGGTTATVTDTLPADLTPFTYTATGWNCTVSGQALSCTYSGAPPIGPNQPLPPITIHATTTQVGSFTNCAFIAVKGGVDRDSENNGGCAPYVVTETPPPVITGCLSDMKVAVTCNPDGTYTLTLSGGSFTGNTITLTSQTTGVTVTPPQQPWAATTSWIITGATAGEAVTLIANATKTGGGSEPGTDQCCSGEIKIVMPECPKGEVVVEKKVENHTRATTAVINALNFSINLACPPSTINTTFVLNNNGIHTENNVPYGSVCTVTETGLPPPPPNVCGQGMTAVWTTPPVITVSPNATIGVPVTTFLVVNELHCAKAGTVTVEKKVINKTRASNAAINALSFPIGLTCGLPSTLNVSFNLSNGGGLHTENNVPYGSLCSVTETSLPAAPPNACPQGSTAVWATPVITVTPNATVGAPTTAFTVVNELDCSDKPPVIDIGIAKTGGTTPACLVPAYYFEVTVTNVGGAWPATGNVVVTDTVPANMTFGPIAAPGWSCPTGILPAGTTFTCTYTGPAPTANQVLPTIGITATPTVGPPFPPYINSASVAIPSSSGYVDTNPANNNATTPPVTKPSSCVCPPPQVMNIDGICVNPPPSPPPPPICPPPLVPGPIKGQCICPLGTAMVDGQCVKRTTCDPPMVPGPVAGQCICGPGYTLRGRECVKTLVCRPPLVPNAAGTDCVCRGGLVLRRGKCVEPVVCRSPARLNSAGTGCDCPEGMTKKGNTCVEKQKPRIRTEDVIKGIGIIRGIGGGDSGGPVRGGGGGPVRGGGAAPGKP